MRIAYCTTLRLPSERAYGHQVARVTDVLARLGAEVEIFSPRRGNPISEDFWSYHRVDRRVRLTYVPVLDLIDARWVPGILQLHFLNYTYCRGLRRLLRDHPADMLYTRNPVLLGPLLGSGKPVVAELHTLPRFGSGRFASLCGRCRKVVCLTSVMRDELLAWGVPGDQLMVEGDAVDIGEFGNLPDPASARRALGLPSGAFVVGYAGTLRTMGISKGTEQIVEAVSLLQGGSAPVHAVIAGGPADALAQLRGLIIAKDMEAFVHCVGLVPRKDVGLIYGASDVLVYPAPVQVSHYFLRDTSPLKIFEYMAARRPIVAADLPPLRDVLDASVAVLYEPGSVQALADAIKAVAADGSRMHSRVERAHHRVQEHTWMKRMKRILSAIQ